MADAGVGEAALLAAVAPEVIGGAAAAGTTAAATAATLAAMAPEAIGAAGALAGTAAVAPELAAAAVPSLGLAIPTTAAEAAASLAPTVATEAPISLFSTQSQPVTGGLLGQAAQGGTVTDASLLGPAAAPEGVPTVTPSGVQVGTEAFGPKEVPGLLDKLGTWWDKATLGEKLKAGGTVLSGVSTAAKATSPSTPQSGPKTTIRPGTTGKPQGGEQTLAQVVEALLKRRDAYTGAQYGAPVAYRPRGLLG